MLQHRFIKGEIDMDLKKKEYALYKGEELLIIGTIQEIAKNQNVKEKTILFYQTPAYLKRREKSHKGNYKVLVKLEEEI